MRVPPGRAGQLWLRHRRSVARHGVEVLRRKQHLLREERDRRVRDVERSQAAWATQCGDAERWMRRALEIAGRSALPAIRADAARASVVIGWARVMNIRLPHVASVSVPATLQRLTATLGGSSAFDRAAERAADAVTAAVEVAAAGAALAALDAELGATTRQIRLLERHRLPELETALLESTRRLEESEREDGIRSRWAAPRRT